ncbi:hypothetical protein T492DRAFT_39569 [Pavlovales sp. CCMP2436]|nr:hypothetical protein T492DRAFT_39569 [Pavlovales sp. CCMP2436]
MHAMNNIECIGKWLERSRTCPLCRTDLRPLLAVAETGEVDTDAPLTEAVPMETDEPTLLVSGAPVAATAPHTQPPSQEAMPAGAAAAMSAAMLAGAGAGGPQPFASFVQQFEQALLDELQVRAFFLLFSRHYSDR